MELTRTGRDIRTRGMAIGHRSDLSLVVIPGDCGAEGQLLEISAEVRVSGSDDRDGLTSYFVEKVSFGRKPRG